MSLNVPTTSDVVVDASGDWLVGITFRSEREGRTQQGWQTNRTMRFSCRHLDDTLAQLGKAL